MTDEQVIALLREIRDEQRAIRAVIERSSAPIADANTTAFMRTLHAYAGTTEFTSVEVAQHAALESAVGLYEVIVAAVGELNPKKIGKLLHRLEGRPLDGFLIWRIGSERNGVIWRIAPLASLKDGKA